MSRPEPKYAVGEAVMIRSKETQFNANYAVVTNVGWRNAGEGIDFHTGADCPAGYVYLTNSPCPCDGWDEFDLQPIPKEKPNGIDALEFIKDLAGVSA